jgi:hypothetical protein
VASPDEVKVALKHARYLAENGVPLFLAEPAMRDGEWDPMGGSGGCGYRLPSRWQRAKADPSVVDEWRPGLALCAVMGHAVDVVDVDPRHGGKASAVAIQSEGLWPQTYGRQKSPSGGWHDLIAPLNVPRRIGFRPGIDVLTDRSFVFLAPTRKMSKTTGEVGAYTWLTPPDLGELALLGDSTGAWIAQELRQQLHSDGSEYDGPSYDQLNLHEQEAARAHVEAVIKGWAARLRLAADWPEGERDDQGRGWEALSYQSAWSLARLAVHPAYPLTDADAGRTYMELLGPLADDARCRDKWGEDLLAKAAAKPCETPVWPSTPSDDFAPLLDEGDGNPESDWLRVIDLAAVDASDMILPTVCPVDGGEPLFYTQAVNGLHGDSRAGKSWVALIACRSELTAGRDVAYLDLEDTPLSIKRRLAEDLRVPASALSRFHYLRPSGPLPESVRDALVARLADLGVGLVVVDSTGEALAAQGVKPNEDDEVANWFQFLPVRLARAGHTVVLLDHVPKALDNRGQPIGSQRKLAAINGAQYAVERVGDGFARRAPGEATITVAKDRQGNRQVNSEAARLRFDGTTFRLVLDAASTLNGALELRMEAVSRLLEALPPEHPGLSVNTIKGDVPGDNRVTLNALGQLVSLGFVAFERQGQSKIHRSQHPYRVGTSADFDEVEDEL